MALARDLGRLVDQEQEQEQDHEQETPRPGQSRQDPGFAAARSESAQTGTK